GARRGQSPTRSGRRRWDPDGPGGGRPGPEPDGTRRTVGVRDGSGRGGGGGGFARLAARLPDCGGEIGGVQSVEGAGSGDAGVDGPLLRQPVVEEDDAPGGVAAGATVDAAPGCERGSAARGIQPEDGDGQAARETGQSDR